MINSLIEAFIEAGKRKNKVVRIQFKNREAIEGLFIITNDYHEMKAKNFWRIVVASKETEWRDTNDIFFSKLFKGDDFTKLSDI